MKKELLFLLITLNILLVSCEYDNFDEPNATLSGNVVYENSVIGVRTNGPQFELWQGGYELKELIPVFIAQDGSYSVSLFDGEYKLVRKEGGPWMSQLTDTLVVNVQGNTILDVPVTPYFIVNDINISKNETSIDAEFSLKQIVETANLEFVNIYLGEGLLTDQNRYEAVSSADIANISFTESSMVSVEIPEELSNENFVYARIGVKSNLSNELYYTQSFKIDLN
ncbi:DUF3823 domain-containing protein [Pseudozobellia sp. WGM2]|uniref:DUF3823 domain-containing protein n=1 Tax=Pseudozobellia sp. WGM2 TaxID=2787625 RepID=UPI001AE05080|nr:DUF3823 domain-containing protein [Pseudozobellia sp. WGM2]